MNLQILGALILSVLPIFELRGAIPIAVEYTNRVGGPIFIYFLLILILNILAIFLAFLFLDFLHRLFIKNAFYRRVVGRFLIKAHRKAKKIEKHPWGAYIGLMLFVSIPIPGTGAWSGALISWILGLDRLRSFIAISAGILIAGILVLLASFGFLILL